MGMYTGIRFKGYVKPEFRKEFKDIALHGIWDESDNDKFKEFGLIRRSSFIPCGCLSYMPDKWETDYINENGEKEIDFGPYFKQIPTDGFDRYYHEETGYWTFQCSLKNYESEIEAFFKLIPYFIQSIDHLEYFYEEWEFSHKYELINNEVICTNNEFIRYYEYE